MKRIAVALLPALIEKSSLKGCTAIVLDILRATSVMTTALANGASRIITCTSVDQAFQLSEQSSDKPLLCGERGGLPIEGFDLSNSPREYSADVVEGKTLVMTTTNGTKALQSVESAENVIAGSLLNLNAVVDYASTRDDVLVVCAGTNGMVTGEDA